MNVDTTKVNEMKDLEDTLIEEMEPGQGNYELRFELRGRERSESPEVLIGSAPTLIDVLEYIGCAIGNYVHLRLVDNQMGQSYQGPVVKHPEIEVELCGHDGNAFAVMGLVTKAMKRNGVSPEECSEYMAEATSGDYDHLLQTTMEWVTVS